MRARALVFLLCLLAVDAARADVATRTPTDEQKRAASTHFTRGAQLYQDGVYRAALIELQRAFEIAPNFHVLYNIGQTYEALGRFVAAYDAYRAYLSQGGAAIDPERKASVEQMLVELEQRIASLVIEVDRPGASIAIDGVGVGKSPLAGPVRVDVGERRVTATSADHATASATIEFAGGDHKQVSLQLVGPVAQVPVASPEVAAKATPAAAPAAQGLPMRARWGIGLLSTGVVLGITGGALAFSARAKHREADRALTTFPGDPNVIDSKHRALERVSIATDALLGTAIATGVTGAFLLAFGVRRTAPEARASRAAFDLRVAPRQLVMEGRF